VAVAGSAGRVGSVVADLLPTYPDFEVVGGVDVGDDLAALLERERPQALVDFTQPVAAVENAIVAAAYGVAPVVGTTGIPPDGVDRVEAACRQQGVGGVVAPNFAVGAVLMMRLAEMAAPYFDAVEVIEAHHATKADAPSGTALATARRLAARRRFTRAATEKVTLEGTRGGEHDGVTVHSLRLPGLVADQEVVFGLAGQTLTIAHRTTSREAFVPGVAMAIRKVVTDTDFHRSLDGILGL
jgi:4-hydroxy-tetrahydrodipicolinate reductase